MSNAVLKNHIYKAIEQIEDDSFLEAVYKIVQARIGGEEELKLSDEQKRILDERRKKHQKGISKSYRWTEVKKELRKSR